MPIDSPPPLSHAASGTRRTSTGQAGDRGGVQQLPAYARASTATTQVTTMPQSGDATSQRLVAWAKKLEAALDSPGGPAMEAVQKTLLGIADDELLPSAIHDAALLEYVSLFDHSNDAGPARAFLGQLHQQAAAGPMDTSVAQNMPAVRNFGSPSLQTSPRADVAPFGRAVQPGPVQTADAGLTPAAWPAPAERPPLNPHLQPKILETARKIVANPTWTVDAHVDDLVTEQCSSNSARKLVRLARNEVAFGASPEIKKFVECFLLQSGRIEEKKEGRGSFVTTVTKRLKSVPSNPGVVGALFDANEQFKAAGGQPADMTLADLATRVPESERRFVDAFVYKPAGYATLGPVSPQAPTPDDAQDSAVVQPPPVAAQWVPQTEMQASLQPPMPLPEPLQVNAQESTDSAAKRQRVQGEFTPMPPNAATIDLPMLTPQVAVQPTQAEPTQPTQVGAMVAAPAGLPVAQATPVVQTVALPGQMPTRPA